MRMARKDTIQALKLVGFLEALVLDLNDELTILACGVNSTLESVELDPISHTKLIDMLRAVHRCAYRTHQALLYAKEVRKD